MDPPGRPHKSRRVPLSQGTNHPPSPVCAASGSPSLYTSNPKSVAGGVEIRRPRSSQTVSIGWDENEDSRSQSTSRLQIDLAECIETKIVTTTTTTKRSYPPIVLQHRSLASLDAKEYPLAHNPTPPEFSHVSYDIERQLVDYGGHNSATRKREILRSKSRILRQSRSTSPQAPHEFCENVDIPIQLERLTADEIDNYPFGSKDSMTRKQERSKTKKPSQDRKSYVKGQLEVQRKSVRKISSNAVAGSGVRHRNHEPGMLTSENTPLPATPDTSELEVGASDRVSRPFADACTPQSGLSQNNPFDNINSPTESSIHEAFASAVATPPIAESDLEPFDRIDESFSVFTGASGQRQPLNIAAAQNASLPSPGLSPTYNGGFEDGSTTEDEDLSDAFGTHSGDSQNTVDTDHDSQISTSRALQAFHPPAADSFALASMLETFDAMPNEMKTVMMFHLLKRCPRKTLHMIADTVNPALKCDFLDQLPLELRLNILGFLDHRDLCRAAQVSKHWRSVIDSNETGWKALLDRDGFALPVGELERAIQQGWGWQDPYGPDGYEQDLSVQHESPPVDSDTIVAGSSRVENEAVRRVRSATKRKRASATSGSERTKRRATGHEFAEKAKGILAKYPHTAKYHKSEGPLTAANAAAMAVPDPQLGLPSLRKLHLFKSLYRRRYMLRQMWTSGKVQPHHFAFPAHPTHVITCLQFDDDKILTGSDDTLIHVYDTRTGVLRKKLEGHEGGVWALQYEGNVLVSGSTDRSVRVWDIEKGLCTQVFHGHTSTVRCLQILMPEATSTFDGGKPVMLPERPLIITGSRDSQLRVWRLPEQGSKRYIQTGPPANDADCPYFVRVLTGHTHSVRAIAAHQDTLVSGSYDHSVRVWKISTGETLHRLAGHSMKVYSVVLDHKRNRCISGSMDNYVKIWDLTTGNCLYTLEGHTSLVGLLDLRDERLVSAAADSTLRIWDPENGQCKSTLTAHTGAITCFQHDGQKVISGSDRTLKMWNVKTGECIKDLLTDLSGVWQVKFDERRCVAAVQRDSLTFVEVLDFGASRDGIPAAKRGFRTLLPPHGGEPRLVEVDDE